MFKNDEVSFLQEIITEGVIMNKNKAKLCKIPQNPFSLPCANGRTICLLLILTNNTLKQYMGKKKGPFSY